jgi:c-di-GMP-binding flagellar brake protein YcgR
MSNIKNSFNRRAFERYRLTPMYAGVTARTNELDLQGHVYDISEGGARIELDEALPPGQQLQVKLALPGMAAQVAASAEVVWVNDQIDDPGPRRMALRFSGFGSTRDRARLIHYLGHGLDRVAA